MVRFTGVAASATLAEQGQNRSLFMDVLIRSISHYPLWPPSILGMKELALKIELGFGKKPEYLVISSRCFIESYHKD
jgi:hypothetical protein